MPLGRIAFSPQMNRFRVRLQSGRDHLVPVVLADCFGADRDRDYHVPMSKRREPREKMHQVSKTNALNDQGVKMPEIFSYLHWQKSGPNRKWFWQQRLSGGYIHESTQMHFSLGATGFHKLGNHMLCKSRIKILYKYNNQMNHSKGINKSNTFLTFHCGHKLRLSICVCTQNSVKLFQLLISGESLFQR